MPFEVKKHFKDLREKTENSGRAKRDLHIAQEEEAQLSALEHEVKRATLKQQCIRAGMQIDAVEAASKAIAEFFCANGLPFAAASPEKSCRFTT